MIRKASLFDAICRGISDTVLKPSNMPSAASAKTGSTSGTVDAKELTVSKYAVGTDCSALTGAVEEYVSSYDDCLSRLRKLCGKLSIP